MVNLVVEHNQRSTWRCPLRELRDASLGGCCGKATEVLSGEPTINITPQLSRHANGVREEELIQIEEHQKKLRSYNTARP